LGSFQETAQFGEIIVLAVSGLAAEDAINLAGKEHFIEKIVIDATILLQRCHLKMGY
jgi:predicted dinucleotide-binding enzyme